MAKLVYSGVRPGVMRVVWGVVEVLLATESVRALLLERRGLLRHGAAAGAYVGVRLVSAWVWWIGGVAAGGVLIASGGRCLMV